LRVSIEALQEIQFLVAKMQIELTQRFAPSILSFALTRNSNHSGCKLV